MILTEQEIEDKVSQCGGTWVKRRNFRRKLISVNNERVKFVIDEIDSELRRCRASTLKESDLRLLYSFKSKMQRRLM